MLTLEERKQFYSSEFNLQRVSEWLGNRAAGKVCSNHGQAHKNFPEKYKEDASTTIIIDEYGNWKT